MDKIQYFKETIEQFEDLLKELQATNAPEEALEMVRDSIITNKAILEGCTPKETEVEAPVEEEGALVARREHKNFKQACIFYGLLEAEAPTPKGNTKKKLEKELSTFCKWHKEGQKIIEDEVYYKAIAKVDNRRKKAIYVNPIKAILFYSLRNFKGELYFSVNKFIELLEIFNKQYHNLKIHDDYKEASEEIGIDIHTLKGFKVGTKRETQRIIERALRSMKSQKIIDYIQGRIIVTNDNNYRIATVEERKKILRIEEEELKNLNCFNMAMLTFRNLESKFYHRIRKRFDEEGLEYINYTFYGYSIVSHDKTISEQIEQLEKEANVIELKGLVKNRLLEFAEGNHKREIKKEYDSIGFGEPILELNPIASSSYIPSFKKAIYSFMDE